MGISRLGLIGLVFFGCATAQPAGPSRLVLQGPDGAATTLDELRGDRKATALVFWSAGCPCVRRYQERVDALLDRYPSEKVRIIAVSSNAGECVADAQQTAQERGVRVPLYRDEDGSVARALGARSTPTAVVLDSRGEVRFRGWIDNERLPGVTGREPWLERALDALVEGRTDFVAKTPTYGCAITRSLGEASGPSCSCHSNQEKK